MLVLLHQGEREDVHVKDNNSKWGTRNKKGQAMAV